MCSLRVFVHVMPQNHRPSSDTVDICNDCFSMYIVTSTGLASFYCAVRCRSMFSLRVDLSDQNSRCPSVHTSQHQYLLRPPLNLSTLSKICFLLTHFALLNCKFSVKIVSCCIHWLQRSSNRPRPSFTRSIKEAAMLFVP